MIKLCKICSEIQGNLKLIIYIDQYIYKLCKYQLHIHNFRF